MSGPPVTVCTPWYPTADNPVGGSFVADWAGLAARVAGWVRVVHAEEWPGGAAEQVARFANDSSHAFQQLARRGGLDTTGTHGPVTRVPTVITTGWSVPQRAEAAVSATRAYAGLADSPIVHGHVGYLGGLMGARLADPSARLVVTEHSTGLADLLGDPVGSELYDEVLERAFRLTTVSAAVRDLVLAHLPRHADKVVVVPNPVNFAPTHQRTSVPERLDRWVFAGGLIERKGVRRLVEAFCAFAPGRPEARLAMFGAGPLRAELEQTVAAHGLSDHVTWHGNVSHSALLAALPDHDVLIAPSHLETFHLVVPEAVAAGIPVVVTRSGGPQEALAGVEDRVGIFVDALGDPDELVAAVLTLEERLHGLDLPGARSILSGRYGPDAVAATLSDLYGTPDRVVAPAHPTRTRPSSVTLLSATGWRGPVISAESAQAREAGVRVCIVSADAGAVDRARPAEQVSPAQFMSRSRPAAGRSVGARGLARRVVGGVVSRGRMTSATADRLHGTDEGTYVMTHTSSGALAQALLQRSPDADLVLEVDRTSLGLAPVDAS